jgi:hypothetical protein
MLWMATGDGFYSLDTNTDRMEGVPDQMNEDQDISKWKS